jgi:hypothetical protein
MRGARPDVTDPDTVNSALYVPGVRVSSGGPRDVGPIGLGRVGPMGP